MAERATSAAVETEPMELKMNDPTDASGVVRQLIVQVGALQILNGYLLSEIEARRPGFGDFVANALDASAGKLTEEAGFLPNGAELRAELQRLLSHRHLIAPPPQPADPAS